MATPTGVTWKRSSGQLPKCPLPPDRKSMEELLPPGFAGPMSSAVGTQIPCVRHEGRINRNFAMPAASTRYVHPLSWCMLFCPQNMSACGAGANVDVRHEAPNSVQDPAHAGSRSDEIPLFHEVGTAPLWTERRLAGNGSLSKWRIGGLDHGGLGGRRAQAIEQSQNSI